MKKLNINVNNIKKITFRIKSNKSSRLIDIIYFLENYHYKNLCHDGYHNCGCSFIDMIEKTAYHFGILEKLQVLKWENK